MKKHYISPLIVLEPLEDEDILISMSKTVTVSYTIDPINTASDTPGIIGESDAPIVIDPSDPGQVTDF